MNEITFNTFEPYTIASSELPDFNPELLPGVYCDFARNLSENAQVAPDMPCIALLSAVGAATMNRFFIQTHLEEEKPLNVYNLIAADPGKRKSTIQRAIVTPFYEIEEDYPDSQLITDNSTYQMMFITMTKNREQMFITSADAGVLKMISTEDRALDLFLKSYDGDPCHYDRVSEGIYTLRHSKLSMMIFAQTGIATTFLPDK